MKEQVKNISRKYFIVEKISIMNKDFPQKLTEYTNCIITPLCKISKPKYKQTVKKQKEMENKFSSRAQEKGEEKNLTITEIKATHEARRRG